jgi:hypothetical protein
MAKQNSWRSLTLVGLIGIFIPFLFNYNSSMSQVVSKKPKLVYNPPKDPSAPLVSRGAVVRGICPESSCLIAVMPGTRFSLDHFPTTIAAHPTFYFNTKTVGIRAQFVLYEIQSSVLSETDIIYKTSFIINGDPGIISFTLPPTAPALEVNKIYRWKLFTYANGAKIIKGFVARVEPTAMLLEQLKQAPPLERAAIYAKAGIWLETVKALADQKYIDPKNQEILAQWSDLLTSVELEKIISQPIVSCCNVEK